MKVIRYTDADFLARLNDITAPSSLFDPVIEERTRAILGEVRNRGDAALVELTQRFDGAVITAEQ
jgi:histidinol dehydrogenase